MIHYDNVNNTQYWAGNGQRFETIQQFTTLIRIYIDPKKQIYKTRNRTCPQRTMYINQMKQTYCCSLSLYQSYKYNKPCTLDTCINLNNDYVISRMTLVTNALQSAINVLVVRSIDIYAIDISGACNSESKSGIAIVILDSTWSINKLFSPTGSLKDLLVGWT